MTYPTPRQREILDKVVKFEWFEGNPAFTRGGDPMALTLYEDLGIDSLELVEIGMEAEEVFALEPILDEDIATVQTLGDVVRLIERMVC